MADLDHFKLINDTYGHLAGDQVLHNAALRIHSAVRTYDYVGRYGGEEFMILMPGCAHADTQANAERLRRSVMDLPISTDAGPLNITLSFGGVATADWPVRTTKQIIHLADGALYRAKALGRNCSVVAEEEEQENVSASQVAHRPAETVKE